MSHTKGEWSMLEYYTVWCEDTQKFEDVSLIHFTNKEEQVANARLIAASPLLLEACKRGHQRLLEMGQRESHRTVSILSAAIAAAEKGD